MLGALDVFLCARVLPVPVTDQTFYKGSAWELAFHGRLALPMAKGYSPGIEDAFPYPPPFALALAGWYRLFGFGGPQDHAFVLLSHLVVVAFCGALAFRLADRGRSFWAPVAAAAAYGYMRLDRPDHLAEALALGAALLLVSEPDRRRLAFAAVLAAGALSVSPAAGLIYSVVLVVLAAAVLTRRELAFAASVAGALLVGGAAAFALASPRASARLLEGCVHVFRAALRFRIPSFSSAIWWVPWFVLFLVFAALPSRRRDPDRRVRGLMLGTLAGLIVWGALTKRNPTYLMLLFPFVVASCVAVASRLVRPAAAMAGIALCFVIGSAIPVLNFARAFAMSPEDTYGYARRLVRDVIPRGSVVLGDGGTFTLLADRYEFYDVTWGSRQLGRADYVVTTGIGTGQIGKTTFEPWGPFKLVADSLRAEPQRLLGIPLGRSRMGYGIRIYRRWSPAAASGP